MTMFLSNISWNRRYPTFLNTYGLAKLLGFDFMEDLSGSKGKEIIFVVLNRFNKYSHFMTFSHPYSATTVSIAFIDHDFLSPIFCHYSVYCIHRSCLNDRDIVFLSQLWKNIFADQRIELHYSTTYHS